MGSATIRATPVVTSVPATNGRIPKRGFANSGVQRVSVKKSLSGTCAKNVSDSTTRIPTIPSVIPTEEIAARKSNVSIMRSLIRDSLRAAGAESEGREAPPSAAKAVAG